MEQLKNERGEGFIDEVFDDFFFQLLCDNDLLTLFDGVDNKWLKKHQRKFLMYAFTDGVPANAHEIIPRGHNRLFKMGLSEQHFDKVIQLLSEALLCQGVEQRLVDIIVNNASPVRDIFKKNAK